jgi:hypothetical protein
MNRSLARRVHLLELLLMAYSLPHNLESLLHVHGFHGTFSPSREFHHPLPETAPLLLQTQLRGDLKKAREQRKCFDRLTDEGTMEPKNL